MINVRNDIKQQVSCGKARALSTAAKRTDGDADSSRERGFGNSLIFHLII